MKYITYNTKYYSVVSVTTEEVTDLGQDELCVEVSDELAEEAVNPETENLRHFDGVKLLTLDEARELYSASQPVVVPKVVAAWRIKAITDIQGLTVSINEAIEAITDPQIKIVAKRSWNEGNEISRTSDLILSMASGMGLTEQQLDDMFVAANTLSV